MTTSLGMPITDRDTLLSLHNVGAIFIPPQEKTFGRTYFAARHLVVMQTWGDPFTLSERIANIVIAVFAVLSHLLLIGFLLDPHKIKELFCENRRMLFHKFVPTDNSDELLILAVKSRNIKLLKEKTGQADKKEVASRIIDIDLASGELVLQRLNCLKIAMSDELNPELTPEMHSLLKKISLDPKLDKLLDSSLGQQFLRGGIAPLTLHYPIYKAFIPKLLQNKPSLFATHKEILLHIAQSCVTTPSHDEATLYLEARIICTILSNIEPHTPQFQLFMKCIHGEIRAEDINKTENRGILIAVIITLESEKIKELSGKALSQYLVTLSTDFHSPLSSGDIQDTLIHMTLSKLLNTPELLYSDMGKEFLRGEKAALLLEYKEYNVFIPILLEFNPNLIETHRTHLLEIARECLFSTQKSNKQVWEIDLLAARAILAKLELKDRVWRWIKRCIGGENLENEEVPIERQDLIKVAILASECNQKNLSKKLLKLYIPRCVIS